MTCVLATAQGRQRARNWRGALLSSSWSVWSNGRFQSPNSNMARCDGLQQGSLCSPCPQNSGFCQSIPLCDLNIMLGSKPASVGNVQVAQRCEISKGVEILNPSTRNMDFPRYVKPAETPLWNRFHGQGAVEESATGDTAKNQWVPTPGAVQLGGLKGPGETLLPKNPWSMAWFDLMSFIFNAKAARNHMVTLHASHKQPCHAPLLVT